MRSVAHLDILGDTPLTRHVVALSAVLLGVGLVGQIFLVVMRGWGMGVGAWLAFYVVATVVALPIHELVHAAAFLLLGRGKVRIRFGYETGMLYTRGVGGAGQCGCRARAWLGACVDAPLGVRRRPGHGCGHCSHARLHARARHGHGRGASRQ